MCVIPGQIYRHYKTSKTYKIITVARDCDDKDRLVVVYKAIPPSPDVSWVRPLTDFAGFVAFSGRLVPRFSLVDKQTIKQKLNNFVDVIFRSKFLCKRLNND